MRAHIDITEVESRTKIRAKYLRAIENEEWNLLPGPVYVKSFLRAYGDFLGLDSRMLVDEYKRRYEDPVEHELRPMSSLTRERERAARGPLIPSWAIIGVVLVAVVAALSVLGSLGSGGKSTSSTAAQHGRRGRHHVASHAVNTGAARPRSVRLQLVPTGPVYICLEDGTGKQLIRGQIFGSGSTIPTETAPKLLLTLGNSSVHMKVNGKPITVTPSASSIGFLLTPSSSSSLPVSQQPHCA